MTKSINQSIKFFTEICIKGASCSDLLCVLLLSALNNSSSGTVIIFLDLFLHPRVYTRIQFVVQVTKKKCGRSGKLFNKCCIEAITKLC